MTSRRALLSAFLAAPVAVKLAPFVKPAPVAVAAVETWSNTLSGTIPLTREAIEAVRADIKAMMSGRWLVYPDSY